LRETKEVRTHTFSLRLSDAEYAVLSMRARAAGHDLAAYIRTVALRNEAPKERKIPAINYQTWGRLGKLTQVLESLQEYLARGGVLDAEQQGELVGVLGALQEDQGHLRVLLLGGTAEDIAG